jgi:hypothetical protein
LPPLERECDDELRDGVARLEEDELRDGGRAVLRGALGRLGATLGADDRDRLGATLGLRCMLRCGDILGIGAARDGELAEGSPRFGARPTCGFPLRIAGCSPPSPRDGIARGCVGRLASTPARPGILAGLRADGERRESSRTPALRSEVRWLRCFARMSARRDS